MKKILSAILLALFLVGSTPSFAFATSGSATSSDIASLLSQISALMRQIEELKAQAKSIRGEVKNISKENKNHDDDRDDDHGRKEKRTVLIPCPDNGGTYTAKWNVFNGKGKHKGEYKKYTDIAAMDRLGHPQIPLRHPFRLSLFRTLHLQVRPSHGQLMRMQTPSLLMELRQTMGQHQQ
jgi:hypothetical protein